MGWPAVFGRLDAPALILYAGSIAWVIAYDTIYAHQDREDDALIGIKSTAILFGEKTKPMLAVFFAAAVVLIGIAGYLADAGLWFALGLAAFAAHLAWQVRSLDISDPALCLRLFKSNRDAGLILFAGMILDAAFLAADSVPRDDLVLAAMHGRAVDAAAGLAAQKDRRPAALDAPSGGGGAAADRHA